MLAIQNSSGLPLGGAAPAGAYDEYLAQQVPRPHQAPLADFLRALPPRDAHRLAGRTRRRIAEQEVTFNILGDPEGKNRPWAVDPLPLVLPRADWDTLAAGLRQRARLLTALYADLYGDRRLLRERVVPAETVMGNPALYRNCLGWSPRGGHQIYLQACDVARDPSGAFRVFSHRTASPTGFGYALQNRLAISGSLQGLFEEYRVERLGSFFSAIRHCVEQLNPRQNAPGRVVVLSAGLTDESSFEHAYLTRYLGYELVEGRDLTVRDRTVYLKTLSGLQRVDVVLRRIHDQQADPLALRDNWLSGVSGLASAAEAGNVALLNPLGSAIAECPVFKPYLSAACRCLLGEDLELPSVETRWCGDPAALQEVLASLNQWVIKPAFEDRQGRVVRPALLAQAERAQWVERLLSSPHGYVAEQWPELSVSPVLAECSSELIYQTLALRMFLCRQGNDYSVMPGALARMGAAPDGMFLAVADEGLSKDVWVPASAEAPPQEDVSLAMPNLRVGLRRGLDVPSRLLDDTYWLGRYLERSESIARLLRCAIERISSDTAVDAWPLLTAIWKVLQSMEVASSGLGNTPAEATSQLLNSLRGDKDRSTLRGQLRSVHGLATRTRSRLSRDAWNVLHRLTSLLEQDATTSVPGALEQLDEVIRFLAAMRGSACDNVVRSHAWTFLDMGCRVERATHTVGLLRNLLRPGALRLHMEGLLDVADSLLAYRSRYLSSLQIAPVVDLLLTDDTNPRSVAFQVAELNRHVQSLPRDAMAVRSRPEKRMIALQSLLLTVDVPQACSGDGSNLRALLEDATELLWQFSDDVSRVWFSHWLPPRAVSAPSWINEELEASQSPQLSPESR